MAQIEETFEATIIKDGRITIPKPLRTKHGIELGERYAFHMVITSQEDKNVEAEDVDKTPSDSSSPATGELENDPRTSL